ncbi:hypothetical protein AA481_004660 [Salmonella enterica subsp. enterica]|nr:hypothetical protein [Salmonella enterica subsp. enterica serovar Abaetetuba]
MINIILSMILCILSTYHIFCGVSFTLIRKLPVPDLLSVPRRAAAEKHNMCHAVRCIFIYM